MDLSFGGSSDTQKRNSYRRGLLGGLALALGIVAITPSCSVIVDTGTKQCEVNTDCPNGMKCEAGVCVGGGDVLCAKTSDCGSLGQDQFCRKGPGDASGVCRSLLSPECQVVEGDPTADNVFLIGSIHPTTATGFDGEIGVSMENSIRLAVRDMKQNVGGLPPVGEGATRPVAMIGCTDAGEGSVSVKAAKHLIDNLGVQAIIGGAFSGVAIQTANEATVPGGALFISASATGIALTDLSDKPAGATAGLVWRTVPSDIFQANAIVQYVPKLEERIRMELGLMDEQIKLALVHKGDAYGQGLRTALQTTLTFNDKPALDNGENFLIVDYGDPDGTTKYPETLEAVKNHGSHIVLLIGTGEAVSSLYGPIEIGWNSALGYKPRYVFSDSNYNTGALAGAIDVGADAAAKADWRRRTTGVVPGPQNTDQNYQLFVNLYGTTFGTENGDPSILGAASAYDAAYLLFYSASTIADGVITGRKLAAGMTKMSKADPPGDEINSGPTKLSDTMKKLMLGEYKSIDYNGAFGPLDFDPETNDPVANIQVFCLSDDGTGKTKEQLSGLYYEADSHSLKGLFTDACK
ncbi:ABC transporter substrate-binding protein [Polyangium jinanense]|uniref:ABC transporter substrate-binding protein n=1 Tax=Polyangium jinanense TaxID=2829994 RepID=A0A9X3X4D1_9BACT|nr:ABC transporter substrate-binding protein [Polyangium jinanense]MDC3957951.1 ABC transporter substrate-binding protein [Polyangium jinanense]MDC3983504.1 ABC transporter substrate-binding protein [Polyangium jinanense]